MSGRRFIVVDLDSHERRLEARETERGVCFVMTDFTIREIGFVEVNREQVKFIRDELTKLLEVQS